MKFNNVNNVYSTINEYNFNNTNYYENNIFNGKSNFKSINKNELIVGEKSDAIKKGALIGTVKVPLDILGKTRTQPSDIGAYEHIIFEK